MSVDVDAWIGSATRTHRAVTLYQRADLIAELDDLDRRILLSTTAGDSTAELTQEWETVAQRFANSALTVTVRGLTSAEIKLLKAEALLERLELSESGANLIASATVEPKLTAVQVMALVDAVGEAQVLKLGQAVVAACTMPPVVNDG